MQLKEDCFAFGEGLIPLAQAQHELSTRLQVVTSEVEMDARAANGRILAADVVSTRNVPPHANTAVDGYAFRFGDLSPGGEGVLTLGGRSGAGHPWTASLPSGATVRVLTGAVLPPGADTVIMQEDAEVRGEELHVPPGMQSGANARKEGEDVCAGTRVLQSGQRIGAAESGMIAALGQTKVLVRSELRVGVFSSGDELVNPGVVPRPGQVFDSNRAMLCGLARATGARVTDFGILADKADRVHDALSGAAGTQDLLLVSGGMSESEEDHVRRVLRDLGTLHFWRLAVKPGRPVGLGQLNGIPVVGLPGNPVAAFVMFLVIARPVIARLTGERWQFPTGMPATAGFTYRKKTGRCEFLRVRRNSDESSEMLDLFPQAGAGILSSVIWSDGLAILTEAESKISPGDPVRWIPFHGLMD